MFEQMHDNQTGSQGPWIPTASVICISLWVRLGPGAHGRSVSFCCRATCCKAMATRVGRPQASGCGDGFDGNKTSSHSKLFGFRACIPATLGQHGGVELEKDSCQVRGRLGMSSRFPSLAPCMRCKIVGYLRVKSPKPKGAAPTI